MDSNLIVTVKWLAEHREEPRLVPVDVRPPHFFAQGHLPGAVNLPGFLLQSPTGGPPDAATLARRLGAAGITQESHVLAYDDGANYLAANLVWLLQYYRHPRVSLLDGGITAWMHDEQEWETDVLQPAAVEYRPGEPDPSLLYSLEQTRQDLSRDEVVLVDVRSPAEFLGLDQRAARSGHIPGAVNVEWSNALVAEDGVARLRGEEELRSLYERGGIVPEKRVIVYCQSGGRAAHTVAVLKALGYPDVVRYPGGWQEWGNRADTPVDEG